MVLGSKGKHSQDECLGGVSTKNSHHRHQNETNIQLTGGLGARWFGFLSQTAGPQTR